MTNWKGEKSQEPQSLGLAPQILRVRMEKVTLGALEGVVRGGGSGAGGEYKLSWNVSRPFYVADSYPSEKKLGQSAILKSHPNWRK